MRWIPDLLEAVRPDAREVDTRDGPPVPYDALLLAVGARPEPALAGAISFAGPRDVLAVRETIEALAPGRPHTIAFVAMAGTAWTLPLYELALMTAEYGRRRGLDLAIEVISSESAPLGMFGAEARAAVRRRLDDAGMQIRSATFPTEYADGKLWLELEGPLDVDLVIALPHLRGTRLPGLPHESEGFMPVDGYGRVRGVERRLGGRRHDDSAAQAGRSRRRNRPTSPRPTSPRRSPAATIEVHPYEPKLQGMLLTGADPLYLERDPHAGPQQKVVGVHLGPYLEALDGPVASVRP